MYHNTFFKHLSKDKEKLKIFKEGLKQGKIAPFDQVTLSRLRRLYYSCFSALIYLYGDETNSKTIGSKVELLTFAFENDEYIIVHAKTDSTREITFLKQNDLNHNSYLEVKRGNKIYVYDTFSMLMFDKDIYEKLEHPETLSISTKEKIQSFPNRSTDRNCYNSPHDIWLAVIMLPQIENALKTNPYQEILSKEILRYKEEINYSKEVYDWSLIEADIYGNQKRK